MEQHTEPHYSYKTMCNICMLPRAVQIVLIVFRLEYRKQHHCEQQYDAAAASQSRQIAQ